MSPLKASSLPGDERLGLAYLREDAEAPSGCGWEMRLWGPAGLAFFLACVAGCGEITDVVDISPSSYQATGDQVVLTPGSRLIGVVGSISTPDPCFEVTSSLKRGDRSIHLTLTARRRGSDPCPAVIAFYSYSGEIDNLTPGRYRVVVSHVYEGTGWDEKRFDREVTVEQ
jgi:hypothetical protein